MLLLTGFSTETDAKQDGNMNVTLPTTTVNLTSVCVQIGDSAISDLLISVYAIAFVLGLIFNILTLGPIWQQMRRQNILGIFLLNLSISDMLFIFTIPLWINYYFQNHHWQLGVLSCSIAGFFYYSNMYISIYLLCCISVDRCIVVSYPLRPKTHRSTRCTWIQCSAVYVVVVVLHILVLANDNLKDAHDDLNNNDRCYETYPMKRPIALFNMLRVGIGFFLPLLVLAVSYWRVLATVDQSPGLNSQTKRKVRLLSYGVIGIFSFCFAPYHILLLIRSLFFYYYSDDMSQNGSYCQFEQKIHFFFSFTLALSSLNCMVDPVLYVLVSNGVQDEVKQFFRWPRSRKTDTECTLTVSKRGKANANVI